MPRLLLLRHATAERAQLGQGDRARALTKGGRKESKAIGKLIAGRGEAIDLVLASDSARTRETWEKVAKRIDGKPEVRFLRAIYEAHDYLPILKSEGGEAGTILLVGHNPAMHETALELADGLAGRDGTRLTAGFSKAALAVLDFDGDWAALRPHQMRLVAFIEPT
jgi:phosphohistidine phosphatase